MSNLRHPKLGRVPHALCYACGALTARGATAYAAWPACVAVSVSPEGLTTYTAWGVPCVLHTKYSAVDPWDSANSTHIHSADMRSCAACKPDRSMPGLGECTALCLFIFALETSSVNVTLRTVTECHAHTPTFSRSFLNRRTACTDTWPSLLAMCFFLSLQVSQHCPLHLPLQPSLLPSPFSHPLHTYLQPTHRPARPPRHP